MALNSGEFIRENEAQPLYSFGGFEPTSVSCWILASIGEGGGASAGGDPSGVTATGLTCFLSSLISF